MRPPPFRRRLALELLENRLTLSTVLYDADLGSRPDQQAWLYLTNPIFGSSATAAMDGNAVKVNTTAVTSEQAGYFGQGLPQLPKLIRSDGFRTSFELQLIAESHDSMDRAGLSVIVLDDQATGVELGFWTGDVWAQADDPLFERAESATVDTTASLARYDVYFVDDTYHVFRDDAFLLRGPVRDYSEFGFPYTTPNFVFVGDDTSSAAAEFRLGNVTVATGIAPGLCVAVESTKLSGDGADPVDFGPVRVGAAPPQRIFDVTNNGQIPLVIQPLVIPAGFELVESLDPILPVGGSSSFTVRMITDSPGWLSGALRIESDQLRSPVTVPVLGYRSTGPVGQNPIDPLDVSYDGAVTPLDVLYVINHINAHPGDPTLPARSPAPFLDVNGDDLVTAIDVLIVINHLNA